MRRLRYGLGCLRVYIIDPLSRWLYRHEDRPPPCYVIHRPIQIVPCGDPTCSVCGEPDL